MPSPNWEFSIALRAIDKVLAPVRQIGRSLDGLKKKIKSTFREMAGTEHLQKLRRGIGDLQNSMKAAGRTFTRAAVISSNIGLATMSIGELRDATWGLLQAPIQVGMEFQSAMGAVRAVAADTQVGIGATSDEVARATENFEALTAEARKLGSTTTFSATQAAQGMDFLARAGFKTNEIIGAMPGMLALAKAGNVELAQAADIASNVLGAFKLSAEKDMGRVADVIVKTFTSSNTSVEMLGDTMKYVAPVAQAVGVSLEEAAGMAGLLGNVGIQSSQAGTVLRSALNRLAGPPKMAAAALHKLGIETKDAAGNMRPITTVMGEIAGAMDSYGTGDRMAMVKAIFGAEAAAGMSELLSQGKENIDAFAENLRNADGTAKAVAETMSNNLQGKMQGFNSALEELKLVVFDAIVPALTVLASWATKVVQVLGNWARNNPILTRTIVGVMAVVGGIAAVLVPLFAIVSTAVSVFGTFSAGITIVKGALLFAIPAIKAFGVALMTTPLGWIIAAIAAVIAILVALFVYREEIAAFFTKAFEAGAAFFRGLLNWAGASLDGFGAWVNGVGEFFASLPRMFGRAVHGLFAWALKIPTRLIGAWEKIKSAWSDAPDWFKGIVALMLLPFLPFLWMVKRIIASYGYLRSFFAQLFARIGRTISGWLNYIQAVWNQTLDKLNALTRAGVQRIVAVWSWVVEGHRRMFARLAAVAMAGFQFLRGHFLAAMQAIANSSAVRLIQSFIAAIQTGVGQVSAGIQQIGTRIRAGLTRLGSMAWNAGSAFVGTLSRAITTRAGRAVAAVKNVLGRVRKLLPFSDAKEGPLSDLTYSGGAMITAFTAGVKRHTGRLVGAIRGAAAKARGQFAPNLTSGITGHDRGLLNAARGAALKMSGSSSPGLAGAAARPAPITGGQVSEHTDRSHVVVDFRNMPRGTSVSQAGGREVDLSLGYAMETG